MSQQKSRHWGRCLYCGRHGMLTVDHVIPRCLFDGVKGGMPGDAPKVYVCRDCNSKKSADDTFLRDVLVRDVRLAHHPIAQEIRHGPHARSLIRGKSQYPREASRLRSVPSPTGSGVMVVEPILPRGRLREIFTRLICGLMLAYEQYELPIAATFDVVRAVDAAWAVSEAQRWVADTSGMVHVAQAGDGRVFWCVYYHPHDPARLDESIWWLRFYEHTLYMAFTGMSNLEFSEF